MFASSATNVKSKSLARICATTWSPAPTLSPILSSNSGTTRRINLRCSTRSVSVFSIHCCCDGDKGEENFSFSIWFRRSGYRGRNLITLPRVHKVYKLFHPRSPLRIADLPVSPLFYRFSANKKFHNLARLASRVGERANTFSFGENFILWHRSNSNDPFGSKAFRTLWSVFKERPHERSRVGLNVGGGGI